MTRNDAKSQSFQISNSFKLKQRPNRVTVSKTEYDRIQSAYPLPFRLPSPSPNHRRLSLHLFQCRFSAQHITLQPLNYAVSKLLHFAKSTSRCFQNHIGLRDEWYDIVLWLEFIDLLQNNKPFALCSAFKNGQSTFNDTMSISKIRPNGITQRFHSLSRKQTNSYFLRYFVLEQSVGISMNSKTTESAVGRWDRKRWIGDDVGDRDKSKCFWFKKRTVSAFTAMPCYNLLLRFQKITI